jgi:lipoate-protein ligase A
VATVVTRTASVAELHALDPFVDRDGPAPDALEVWHCDPTDAAVVLGSRQEPELLDPVACRSAGLEIVRRRSGGGVVLLRPDAVVWLDLVVPHGAAPDDIRGSMLWAGERWCAALEPLVDGRLTVHRGGMVDTAWSDLACFAGLGPGEVLLAGRKLVGLSQRRTRNGVRIQGSIHRRTLQHELPGLFATDLPDERLEWPAVAPDLDAGALARRLADPG